MPESIQIYLKDKRAVAPFFPSPLQKYEHGRADTPNNLIIVVEHVFLRHNSFDSAE